MEEKGGKGWQEVGTAIGTLHENGASRTYRRWFGFGRRGREEVGHELLLLILTCRDLNLTGH